MSWTCGAYGKGIGVHTVLEGSLRERDHWGDTDVYGRIILIGILRKWGGCRDWMERAQDRDMWRALVSTYKV
jgi:hypothetical protein